MLTKRQKEILTFITAFEAEHGIIPTIREVAAAFQLTSPATAFKHIQSLKKKGYISTASKGWRSHKPIELQETMADDFRQVTIIGRIKKDSRIELFATILLHWLPKTLLQSEATYYGFVVVDNSFSDQLLLTGDLVVIDASGPLQVGDTALVHVGEEGITIQEYTGSVRHMTVHGKLVMAIRSYTTTQKIQ